MPVSAPVFFNRPDTFFGVCEAIGQDFGFHPNILRIAFALMVLASPVAVMAAYVALGIAVMVSRLLVPVAKPVTVVTVVPDASNDVDDMALAQAA